MDTKTRELAPVLLGRDISYNGASSLVLTDEGKFFV